MYSVTNSFGLNGLRGFAVAVEADVSGGLPAFSIVGLPDSAVRESADRVRAAIKNLGFRFPDRRITINLAPADVRKTGPVYDLPLLLAETFRAASRFKLELYPGVREVLDELRPRYRMAALSDGQSVWALPELRSVGLEKYFDPVIVSGDLGFRKPDPRMFELLLSQMELSPDEILFVGNDMYRDIFGAGQLGIRTVFFRSNQGDQRPAGREPDYIIYRFSELPEAVRFLSK